MVDVRIGEFIVTMSPGFRVGDPAPPGYLDWHEWAEIQYKGGLRQTVCPICAKWQFPQELSTVARGRKRSAFVCLKCAEAKPSATVAAKPDGRC